MIKALKKLGFYGVSETALGAHEVSRHTIEILKENTEGIFISTACPTIVEYIKKYQSELSGCMTESLSPLQTHCRLLKKHYGEEISIIFAGPCISKKREADLRPDLLNLAISFEDIHKWLDDNSIDPTLEEPDETDVFIPATSKDGALYPSEGGMIASILHQNGDEPTGQMLSFSDIHSMGEILNGLDKIKPRVPCFWSCWPARAAV